MYRIIFGFVALIVFVALSLFVAPVKAEVVDFVVDPTLTRWSMRGGYFREGQPQADLVAQFPGSETTSLTGIIRVELTPTTIQFLPSSSLDAVLQPLPQQPGHNGAAGAAPADYGMAAPSLPAPTPFFATRDFGFTFSSPPIPLVEFQSALQFTEDIEANVNFQIDYNLGTAAGSLTRTNWSRGFDDDNVGRMTNTGLVQTIRLQNYLGEIFALQSPADSFLEWSGPIVATRVIPEPSGVLLAGLALAAFGLAVVRRRMIPPFLANAKHTHMPRTQSAAAAFPAEMLIAANATTADGAIVVGLSRTTCVTPSALGANDSNYDCTRPRGQCQFSIQRSGQL
jgi:hypothetical protein